MTDALEFIHSEVTASSDESELESEDSFATRSYEEEGEFCGDIHSDLVGVAKQMKTVYFHSLY